MNKNTKYDLTIEYFNTKTPSNLDINHLGTSIATRQQLINYVFNSLGIPSYEQYKHSKITIDCYRNMLEKVGFISKIYKNDKVISGEYSLVSYIPQNMSLTLLNKLYTLNYKIPEHFKNISKQFDLNTAFNNWIDSFDSDWDEYYKEIHRRNPFVFDNYK